ncbi:hypothetical protein ACH4U6_12785 [Streptomyces netropsis]|uniref:hypothetical protein n=1 Tax=Streptomyces netropsis TaxID=55404 RepID=UPI0037BB3AFD
MDSSTARPGDDIHMLLYQGGFCGMLYSNADVKNGLPVVIGINDNAAFQAGDLGRKYA